MNKTENNADIYCTTSFAAKKLGVSTATLQKLADKDLFLSWKTPGGHRRINLPSLIKYIEKLNDCNSTNVKNKHINTILLIDDDQEIFRKITKQNIKLNKPIKIFYANSLVDILVKKIPDNPDLIIMDMKTNSRSKIEFLKMTASTQPQTTAIAYNFKKPMEGNRCEAKFNNIIIIDELTEEWYHGFLSGLIHFKNRFTPMKT